MEAHHIQYLGVPVDARKEEPHIEPHEMRAHFFASKSCDGYSLMLWSYTTKEAHPTPLTCHFTCHSHVSCIMHCKLIY